jgi:hypothetical protein
VEATDRPPWAGPDGLPTIHVARAAVHVAAVLDLSGSRVVDADESYWHRATGGAYAPPDLRLGQSLLLDLGLVEELDRVLYPLPPLHTLVDRADDESAAALVIWAAEHPIEGASTGLPQEVVASHFDELSLDPARREQMLLALARRFDNSYQRLLGEIGEEVVLACARRELADLGYPQLAAQVRRISLVTDQTGYDITAPRAVGSPRLLEVKSGTFPPGDRLAVHLSRNEYDTGRRFDDWALVVCRVTDIDRRTGEILGWIDSKPLSELVPIDRNDGQWENALISIDADDLIPGLPAIG